MARGTELTRILDLISAEKQQKIIPANIKSGIEVLGITGEYTGIKTYSSVSAMNNDLANIQENEIAKVVVDDVTTYYIKNTTMKELYKEGTTLSPTNYAQAQIQIANLLDEEVLPYTELEYIQSTGTQYINTDIVLDSTNIVETTIRDFDMSVRADYTIWSANNGVWDSGQYILVSYDQKVWWCCGTNIQLPITSSGEYKITVQGTGVKVNDTTVRAVGSYSGTVSNLCIMNTAGSRLGKYKLCEIKVLDSTGTTTLYDLIPVKMKSDDEICLYDKVEGEFYTNDGTGDFIAGPEID